MSYDNKTKCGNPVPDMEQVKELAMAWTRVEQQTLARQAREDAWLRANGHHAFADAGDFARRKTKESKDQPELPEMIDLLGPL